MRRLLALAVLLFFLLAASAQAFTIQGGSADQQRLVKLVCNWQPPLLQVIENKWPDFYVRVNYGGHAWDGFVDVTITKTGWTFSHIAAHEFCHEVQLAADQSGLALGSAWLDELTERGYGPDTWIWPNDPVWSTRRNPWEAFAENMRRALFLDFSVNPTTPNTVLAWLQPGEMVTFLQENGIEVWGR
jgi:hypothetical protein